jgi:ABC-type glycerol-3-phosphate transport system substrate-binding protein
MKEEHAMFSDRTATVGAPCRRLLALVGGLAIVISACGGSNASPSAASSAPAAASSSPATAPSAPPSAAPSDAGYTGPDATITYSIWGDPQEIKNQQAIVDAFHAANPKITVKVTVSEWDTYWDKLQTGIAGG